MGWRVESKGKMSGRGRDRSSIRRHASAASASAPMRGCRRVNILYRACKELCICVDTYKYA